MLAEVAGRLGPRLVASDRELAGVTRDALSAYLEGDDDTLELPVDLGLVHAPFRRARAGDAAPRDRPRRGRHLRRAWPSAAGARAPYRAAATACARNPVPIVVPCHRVLPASGGIGNYGGGPERKLALLELEGALPTAARRP